MLAGIAALVFLSRFGRSGSGVREVLACNSSHGTRSNRAVSPFVEFLEDRQLLTGVMIQRADNILRITGTENGDVLTVEVRGSEIEVRENAATLYQADLGSLSRLVLDGGEGEDSLEVLGTLPAILIGGAGKDTLSGGDGLTAYISEREDVILRRHPNTYEYLTVSGSERTEEQEEVLALVPYGQIDTLAISSGDWSSSTTWFGGVVPKAGADVLIPARIQTSGPPTAMSVTVSRIEPNAVRTLRIDGTLNLTGTKVLLTADTVVVAPKATFNLTATGPRTQAVLEIANNTSLEVGSTADPHSLSQGLLVLGAANLRGQTKAPYLMPAMRSIDQNKKTLVLQRGRWTPRDLNWNKGDLLVIPASTIASTATPNEGGNRYITEVNNEVVRITRVRPFSTRDSTVTIDFERADQDAGSGKGLQWPHDLVLEWPGIKEGTTRKQALPITNLSRSAVVRSHVEPANQGSTVDVLSLGHVLFLGTRDVSLEFAGFENLGRTDKSREVTEDPTNQRGRYAVHFHHAGTDVSKYNRKPLVALGALATPQSARLDYATNTPIQVVGSVVNGGPGWGFVNHGSFIRFDGNVAHDLNGAGFVAEDGDELGAYTRNVAVGITTSARTKPGANGLPVTRLSGRKDGADFAFTGDGFWFQGPSVRVEDNFAVGLEGNGYVYFTFDSPRVHLGHAEEVFNSQINSGRIENFRNNVAVAVDKGLSLWKHRMPTRLTEVARAEESLIFNFTVLNAAHNGVELSYVSRVRFEQIHLINLEGQRRFGQATYGFGLVDVNAIHDLTYQALNVRGFKFGLLTVPTGHVKIGDRLAPSVLDNDTDLVVTTNRGGFNFLPNNHWDNEQKLEISNVTFLGQIAIELQAGTLPLDPCARTEDGDDNCTEENVDPFQHLFAQTSLLVTRSYILGVELTGQLFFLNQAREEQALLAAKNWNDSRTVPDWQAQREDVVAGLMKMGIEKDHERTGELFANDLGYFAEYREKTNGDLAGRQSPVAYGDYLLDRSVGLLPMVTGVSGGFLLTEPQVRDWVRTV